MLQPSPLASSMKEGALRDSHLSGYIQMTVAPDNSHLSTCSRGRAQVEGPSQALSEFFT